MFRDQAPDNREVLRTALEPHNERERALWAEIDEEVDHGIQSVMKRLNRVAWTMFLELDLNTVTSCSGHVNRAGTLWTARSQKFLSEHPSNPHLGWQTLARSTTREQHQAVKQWFNREFQVVVERVNASVGHQVIEFTDRTEDKVEHIYPIEGEPVDVYLYFYRFNLRTPENAVPVLRALWIEIEAWVSQHDHLPLAASLTFEQLLRPLEEVIEDRKNG